MSRPCPRSPLFSLTVPPPPEIYTHSLHDALPIFRRRPNRTRPGDGALRELGLGIRSVRLEIHVLQAPALVRDHRRSEELTSELQSRRDLVCRLLLEKKKIHIPWIMPPYTRPLRSY